MSFYVLFICIICIMYGIYDKNAKVSKSSFFNTKNKYFRFLFFFFFIIVDSTKFLLITDTYNSFTLNIVNILNKLSFYNRYGVYIGVTLCLYHTRFYISMNLNRIYALIDKKKLFLLNSFL